MFTTLIWVIGFWKSTILSGLWREILLHCWFRLQISLLSELLNYVAQRQIVCSCGTFSLRHKVSASVRHYSLRVNNEYEGHGGRSGFAIETGERDTAYVTFIAFHLHRPLHNNKRTSILRIDCSRPDISITTDFYCRLEPPKSRIEYSIECSWAGTAHASISRSVSSPSAERDSFQQRFMLPINRP